MAVLGIEPPFLFMMPKQVGRELFVWWVRFKAALMNYSKLHILNDDGLSLDDFFSEASKILG